uniref:Uncharacterized protein n=1 Tax=Anguilla anguilla TaxID=7936 RepID=A0A0E9SKT8_ANGAN
MKLALWNKKRKERKEGGKNITGKPEYWSRSSAGF